MGVKSIAVRSPPVLILFIAVVNAIAHTFPGPHPFLDRELSVALHKHSNSPGVSESIAPPSYFRRILFAMVLDDRRSALENQKHAHGFSATVEVVRVDCGGRNWIPESISKHVCSSTPQKFVATRLVQLVSYSSCHRCPSVLSTLGSYVICLGLCIGNSAAAARTGPGAGGEDKTRVAGDVTVLNVIVEGKQRHQTSIDHCIYIARMNAMRGLGGCMTSIH